MAEVNVERRQEERGRGVARRSQTGELGRWGEFGFPSLWRNPDELFSVSPFTLMRRFTEDLDRMFSGFGAVGRREIGGWAPPVEVRERDGNLVVSAELPGLNKDDVKVEVQEDAVIIRGERKREWEEEREGVHPQGRAAVRLNGLKHGLTASTLVLQGESEEDFHNLLDSFEAEHQPATPTEVALVRQMAMAEWRRIRQYHMESGLFTIRLLDYQGDLEKYTGLELGDQLAIVARNDSAGANVLPNFSRYEARLERSFLRALRELQRLRALRQAEMKNQSQSQSWTPDPEPPPAPKKAPRAAKITRPRLTLVPRPPMADPEATPQPDGTSKTVNKEEPAAPDDEI